MKIKFILLLVLLISYEFAFAQNLLKGPQKIVIDAKRNRLLVSNFDSGDIVQIDSNGKQSYFCQNAGFVDGIEIVGDIVYGVGSNRKISGYDLRKPHKVFDINIPGDPEQYLSSICSDSNGHLFVSCPKLNAIYRIRLSDGAYWTFAKDNGLNRPNGILLENEKNRIVVIDDSPAPSLIHSISLIDSTVTTLKSTAFDRPDGIVRDKPGNYFIGGYYLQGLYKINSDFNGDFELFYEGNNIVYPTYDPQNNSLLVTFYNSNSWGKIPIPATHDENDFPVSWVSYLEHSGIEKKSKMATQSDVLYYFQKNDVIAYSITYRNNTNKIFLMKDDGSENRQLSNQPGRPLSPVWSPDASKIAFYNHISDQKWTLFIMNSDGTNTRQLTNDENTLDWYPSWSPDGNQILFTRSYTNPTWRSEIWIIKSDGTNLKRISNIDGQGGDLSPDGSRIVYFNYTEGGGDIWVMNKEGSNTRKLTDNITEDWWPNWSPDGGKIVYQSKVDGNFEIYTMNTDGSNFVRLTNNEFDDEEPKWSPDGSRIVFSSLRDGHYEIYVMNADGSDQKRLTKVDGQAINPDWKPVQH